MLKAKRPFEYRQGSMVTRHKSRGEKLTFFSCTFDLEFRNTNSNNFEIRSTLVQCPSVKKNILTDVHFVFICKMLHFFFKRPSFHFKVNHFSEMVIKCNYFFLNYSKNYYLHVKIDYNY